MAHIPHMRYGTIGVLLVICALSGAAAAPSIPSIALDKVEDDFGDVHAGMQVEKRFVVSNKGNAPLVIEYIRTSCGCTTAVAQSEQIPPGEKTDILVSYDTTGLSAGKKTQAVLINSNDPKQPVARIRIFANVVHDVSLDPENLITQLDNIPKSGQFLACGTKLLRPAGGAGGVQDSRHDQQSLAYARTRAHRTQIRNAVHH